MSEWGPCPHCYAPRENLCACNNPQCPEGVPRPPSAPECIVNPLYRLRGMIDQAVAELENRDVTLWTVGDLIELRQAADRIQNAGISANHAVDRMIRRWQEKHDPERLRAYEAYAREENKRACTPSPEASQKSTEPNDYTRVYAGGKTPEQTEVLREIDQTP